MKFSFSAPLDQKDSSIGWSNIVMIPDNLHHHLAGQKNPRVKVIFNGQIESHISVKSSGEFRYLVLNNQVRSKLKLQEGDVVTVDVEEEQSEYGMPMPEELALMLAEDETANEFFHQLTPGKQRSLIYIVSKVKNVDSRIRKALGIAEHLNEYQGLLDYKALHLKIKEVNERSKMGL